MLSPGRHTVQRASGPLCPNTWSFDSFRFAAYLNFGGCKPTSPNEAACYLGSQQAAAAWLGCLQERDGTFDTVIRQQTIKVCASSVLGCARPVRPHSTLRTRRYDHTSGHLPPCKLRYQWHACLPQRRQHNQQYRHRLGPCGAEIKSLAQGWWSGAMMVVARYVDLT